MNEIMEDILDTADDLARLTEKISWTGLVWFLFLGPVLGTLLPPLLLIGKLLLWFKYKIKNEKRKSI